MSEAIRVAVVLGVYGGICQLSWTAFATYAMGSVVVFFFFFQAEDGIRDLTVTGQTCALPIWSIQPRARAGRSAVGRGRRQSSYFVPIPHGRRQTAQRSLEAEWTKDRLRDNELVNRIREKVATWRKGGHAGVTGTTARLLSYWTAPDRDRKLFFCQIEALETAIYLAEVASKYGDAWIENQLREANETGGNPELFRVALKMATGSGKTVVMGMLIAWQALNKFANPQDARFSDAFLVVCPGITIRDRLRVLLPNDPENYYRQRDVLPPELLEKLERAKIVITNYHAFLPRERGYAARLTKKILGSDETGAFKETLDQVVHRVCRELGNKRSVVVLNHEAHHCYLGRPDAADEPKVKGDGRQEAQQRE